MDDRRIAREFMPRKECQEQRLKDAQWKQDTQDRLYDIQKHLYEDKGKRPPEPPHPYAPSISIPMPLSTRDIHIVLDKKSGTIMTLVLCCLAIMFITLQFLL